MVETGIVKVVIVEACLPTANVVVGAKKTTTTGITLVNETGGTMIMTTTEVDLGVIAEGEKGDIVDSIERIGLVEIDHMRSLEKGLSKDPAEIGLEIGIGTVIGPGTEIDPVIGETDIVKIINLVYTGAKVLITKATRMQPKGENQTPVAAQIPPS